MNSIVSIEKDQIRQFSVSWKMTQWCNQKCSYCFQKHTEWIDYSKICTTADLLNQVLDKIDLDIDLQLVGGEITYYNLIDLLDNHLTSKNLKTITLITNFSRDIYFFNKLSEYCINRGVTFSIVVSYHDEYTSFRDLMEKIIKLNKDIRLVHINVVVTNQNYSELKKDFIEIKNWNNELSDLFFKKVQILKDQNGLSILAEKEFKALLEEFQKCDDNWTIIFKDNTKTKLNRSKCQVLNQSYFSYNCTRVLRLDLDNKFKAGTCYNLNTPAKVDIHEFLNKSKEEILEFCTSKCKQYKCNLCGFTKIFLSKDTIENEI